MERNQRSQCGLRLDRERERYQRILFAHRSQRQPGFAAQPNNVYINGANATEGTAGSLTAGQWDYADNDTLGYSTIYVRLSDGTDPDSKTNGYVAFYQTPRATEHVRFPYGAGDATTAVRGLTNRQPQSAIWFSTATAGLSGRRRPTLFDPDKFEFDSTGQAWIDIGAAAIPVIVKGTPKSPAAT